MDLWKILEEETSKAKIEHDEEEMWKDYNDMNGLYIQTDAIKSSFSAYKYFVENLYEPFVANMIRENHDSLVEEVGASKGSIIVDTKTNFDARGDTDFDEPNVSDSDYCYFGYNLEGNTLKMRFHDMYGRAANVFCDMLDGFFERNELGEKSRNYFKIDAPFPNIINAYNQEKNRLPYLEEEVNTLKSDFETSDTKKPRM